MCIWMCIWFESKFRHFHRRLLQPLRSHMSSLHRSTYTGYGYPDRSLLYPPPASGLIRIHIPPGVPVSHSSPQGSQCHPELLRYFGECFWLCLGVVAECYLLRRGWTPVEARLLKMLPRLRCWWSSRSNSWYGDIRYYGLPDRCIRGSPCELVHCSK